MTQERDLAHTLWAMAQGPGAIEDAVDRMAEVIRAASAPQVQPTEAGDGEIMQWQALYALDNMVSHMRGETPYPSGAGDVLRAYIKQVPSQVQPHRCTRCGRYEDGQRPCPNGDPACPVSVQPSSKDAPKPCPNCDDTGDVHRADGEYMGRCTCAAIDAALAAPAQPDASCLCCGKVGTPKAWSMSNPTVYVCERCHRRATLPTPDQLATEEEGDAFMHGYFTAVEESTLALAAPSDEQENHCKLTECQGKPRCKPCLTMDAAYGRPLAAAPASPAAQDEQHG